jgi:hypothetical protein
MITCNREEIRDMACICRSGILIGIEDNADGHIDEFPTVTKVISIDVDNYEIPEGSTFDMDEFEAHQGHIYAPADRQNWQWAYRIARTLVRHGSVNFIDLGITVSLPETMYVRTNEEAAL